MIRQNRHQIKAITTKSSNRFQRLSRSKYCCFNVNTLNNQWAFLWAVHIFASVSISISSTTKKSLRHMRWNAWNVFRSLSHFCLCASFSYRFSFLLTTSSTVSFTFSNLLSFSVILSQARFGLCCCCFFLLYLLKHFFSSIDIVHQKRERERDVSKSERETKPEDYYGIFINGFLSMTLQVVGKICSEFFLFILHWRRKSTLKLIAFWQRANVEMK